MKPAITGSLINGHLVTATRIARPNRAGLFYCHCNPHSYKLRPRMNVVARGLTVFYSVRNFSGRLSDRSGAEEEMTVAMVTTY